MKINKKRIAVIVLAAFVATGSFAKGFGGLLNKAKESVGLKGSYDTSKPNPETDFEYVLDDAGTGIVIAGYKGGSMGIVIPSTIEDFPVVELKKLKYWSGDDAKLYFVFIPESVKKIGSLCFSDFSGTLKIQNLGNIEEIGDSAFSRFSGKLDLDGKEFTIDHLKKAGDSAFAECNFLKGKITVRKDLIVSKDEYGDETVVSPFTSCAGITEVVFEDGIETIKGFDRCTSLESVTLPASAKKISDIAFRDCTNLKTINLADTKVETIERGAFKGCTNLEPVSFPVTLKTIDDEAFNLCSSITSLILPKSLEEIGKKAFGNCISLKDVAFEDGSTYDFSKATKRFGVTLFYPFVNCKNLGLKSKKALADRGYPNSWEYDSRAAN